jgi:signal transduction histidine kinase/DNA-binding response OmpR family regulator
MSKQSFINYFSITIISFSVFSPPAYSQNKNDLSAQPGIPLISNYTINNYSAGMQNWCGIQDKRGVLYFANESGILEYNGDKWRLISVPNNVVRSLAIDKNGRIYVGGLNQFGYLKHDSTGQLNYFSLNKLLPKNKKDLGDVWTVIVNPRGLFIQTFKNLFLFKADTTFKGSYFKQITHKPVCKIWNTKTRINPIFSVNNQIYVHERYVGIQKLVGDSLKLVPGGEQFAQDLICVMLPFNNFENIRNDDRDILIGSLRRGLYIFNGRKFEKFNNQADDYLIKNRLYFKGTVLGNGSFAFGTQLGGIVIIDKNGRLKKIINKKVGLNDGTIWYLFVDREGNLWATLNNGIAKILYPSSLSEFDEKSGFSGSVNSVKEFNNEIYLTTGSGVYLLNKEPDETGNIHFIQIKGIAVQSWDVYKINGKILAATNDGIFEIAGTDSKLVDKDLRYTLCLHQLHSDSSIIYAGIQTGLTVLKFDGKYFRVIGKIPGVSNPISDIEDDKNGHLYLEDVIGNLNVLNIPGEKTLLDKYSIYPLNFPNNKVQLFYFNKKVYFYNDTSIFNYDFKMKKITAAKEFDNILPNKKISYLSVFSNQNDVLWMIVEVDGKIQAVDLKFKSGVFVSSKLHPFLQVVLDNYSANFIPLKFFVQKNNRRLWIGVVDKLISYEPELNINKRKYFKLNPMINKIIIGSGRTLFNGVSNDKNQNNKLTEINFSDNSLTFDFSLPSFIKENGNDFQYKLEGFDKDWSKWSKETKKEYTNLSAGKYTFWVRGRNAIGQVSSTANFPFEILSAWYRTWWANLLGFLVILYLIYSVVRFRVRILEKRNVILERTVNERTTQIQDQKKILEDQADKLMELDKVKSNFFANISHEFRTPLTLIKGQIESVLDNITDEKVKRRLNVAHSNSDRLHRLINQILNLSRLESGKLTLEQSNTDIVSLVKNRVSSFDSLANQRGIKLKIVDKIDSQILFIDREKIEEVLDNLISNAFKFTAAGGTITVTIESQKADELDEIKISIEDTGIGIPKEKLSKIFDRFFQVDDTSTKQYEGTGLGLTIVKELVELHSGKIKVESEIGTGSKFTITLPVTKASEEILSEQTHVSLDKDESRELILVVEDNPDVRSYIKENLENTYRVLEAVDGEDGIKKAIENIPDLIISDVMMPKADGYELCNKLKSDQRTSHIPLILLTAKADEKSKLEGLKLGADEFLSKPFSPKELDIRVGNLIKIRQLLREKYKEISVLNPQEINVASLDKIFLEKTFQIIKEHLEDNKFNITKLAEEVGMSVSQLNRKLNALINQSAGKLIRSTRLDYAAKLLEKKAGNISEIAYRIGFGDTPSFTHSFKEKFGCTPSEYLKSKEL